MFLLLYLQDKWTHFLFDAQRHQNQMPIVVHFQEMENVNQYEDVVQVKTLNWPLVIHSMLRQRERLPVQFMNQ